MTDRYVGPGGNDGNDGLSWANRKLTLNGAEDTPVVAGDTVYVGPGVYRELLTTDVDGTSGAVITYIGDVTGENTDGIGGIVRITGSDDDQSATRASTISVNGEDYRTFRGFFLDTTTSHVVQFNNGIGNIIEDCWLEGGTTSDIFIGTGTTTNTTVRRCIMLPSNQACLYIADGTSGHLFENCLFISQGGGNGRGIRINNADDAGTIKNCTFIGGDRGIDANTALNSSWSVNNCIFFGNNTALDASATGDLIEDFNTFWKNTTDRTNVATGGNSVTYPPLFTPSVLIDGFVMPWLPLFGLSEWSQTARIAGSSEAVDDLFGIVRPTTSAKNSWGAIQLREAERETGTVQTGSAALTLADAGDHQIFVPVTATSTTFEVAARYESEYAGTLPRLIVRQPGQADQVDTMVAAADTWETLSLTFTPSATPPYVVIILRSLNTSVSGDFDTYWDDLDVS